MPKRKPSDGCNPAPVRYRGGVVYTSWATKKFRALRERGNRYSEACCQWGDAKPNPGAWKKAINAIDAHYDKKGKK